MGRSRTSLNRKRESDIVEKEVVENAENQLTWIVDAKDALERAIKSSRRISE
jgi:hypothetical protein